MSINSLLVPNNYPLNVGDLTTEDITATRITSEDVTAKFLTIESSIGERKVTLTTKDTSDNYILVLPETPATNEGKPLMLDRQVTGELGFTLPSIKYIKYENNGSTVSTTFVSIVSGSITPRYPTSLIKVSVSGVTQKVGTTDTAHVTLLKDGVDIGSVSATSNGFLNILAGDNNMHTYSFEYLDQPPVGVSVEYSLAVRVNNGADSIVYGSQLTPTVLLIQEIFAEAI